MVDGWVFSKEKTSQLINGSPFIINFSQENYGNITVSFFYSLLKDLDVNFVLLSFDPNDHLIQPNILYYPFWYFQSINDFELNQTYNDIRKFKISCLNGNHRPHRIYNFLTIKNKSYFDEFLFKMVYDKQEVSIRDDDIVLPDEFILEWEKIKSSLPSKKKSSPFIKEPAWNDSYINFVTETTVNKGLFVTEKTWKPIASEQLFIIYGNVGIISHLRELGVDTFDDIIDHNYYDSVLDWQERLFKIHEVIETVLQQDIEKIFKNTKARRLENRRKFVNGWFGEIFVNCVNKKCIEMLQ